MQVSYANLAFKVSRRRIYHTLQRQENKHPKAQSNIRLVSDD